MRSCASRLATARLHELIYNPQLKEETRVLEKENQLLKEENRQQPSLASPTKRRALGALSLALSCPPLAQQHQPPSASPT